MKRIIVSLAIVTCALHLSIAHAQTNILSTDSTAAQVLIGAYDPIVYAVGVDTPMSIVQGINMNVSSDSLRQYLETLGTFYNRNTGSDTSSSGKGIGAARRWVFRKFQEFSAANSNRLIPSYMQFDRDICGIMQHRNIFAVLPGTDTSDKSVVLIEGHIDSRCFDVCDTTCLAQGMEDNASGTVLVLELARVMSAYRYNRTIVFLVTIAEEQGLYGAQAFATYSTQKGVKYRGVINNDIVGGVICGNTSSPPSCPTPGLVDSTQVRLFSYGGFNSPHKALARFVKLQYKEMLQGIVAVPMLISIMTAEDRTNRGGDHIPFRMGAYSAIRVTSANEHGDASNDSVYTDRQHTSRDILGVDVSGDGSIDSFYVDFHYLARNTVINGVAAAMMAVGPRTPDCARDASPKNRIAITITKETQYPAYRIGVRTTTNDWDSVYTITGRLTDTLDVALPRSYFISVASVDSDGVESTFSREQSIGLAGVNDEAEATGGLELLPNKPNPFDEATIITVKRSKSFSYNSAKIIITDMSGVIVRELDIDLHNDINEVTFAHGYGVTGTYTYTLLVDGRAVSTRKMIFQN